MKITFLLVERTFLSSIDRAVQDIRSASAVDLDVAVHVLSDLNTDGGWSPVERDVADSEALFAIHVTSEAASEKLRELLSRSNAGLKAFVPFNCVGSLMREARIGRLRLSGREGFMSSFGSLIRRPSKERSAESIAGLMGRVTRWLRFAPGKAQDLRTYLLLYTYYLNSSPDNLRNMLLLTLDRVGHVAVHAAAPIEYPTSWIYHPETAERFETLEAYLSWFHSRSAAPDKTRPQVGLILFRSFVLNGNTAHYDAVIRAIEARGLVPVPALSFALDNRTVQRKYFENVQAILSLTGFGYVGGMGANDAEAAVAELTSQDVPYLNAVALTFQRVDQWLASEVGLNPLQSMMQVAIPELDGATSPLIFGGITEDRAAGFQPVSERVEALAQRVARLVDLRVTPNAGKRIAVTLFSFPPGKGTLGTAAYLNVFQSLHRLLERLARDGYSVDLPENADELRSLLLEGNSAGYGSPANVAATLSTADYLRLWPHFPEVEACWGRAPGDLNTFGRELLVLGRHFGNIFVGVQPSFGFEGDPIRLLSARGQTPHHGFCAFYVYLQKVWNAHAVLHFGTHGSLEFMPGKQVGLSESCWPDRLIGPLPNVYLYSVGNPSEGTIAKRRSNATLVSYMSPPMNQAGLYKELLQLQDLVDLYRRSGDVGLMPEIRTLAGALEL